MVRRSRLSSDMGKAGGERRKGKLVSGAGYLKSVWPSGEKGRTRMREGGGKKAKKGDFGRRLEEVTPIYLPRGGKGHIMPKILQPL